MHHQNSVMSSVSPATRMLRRRVRVSASVARLLAELAGLDADVESSWESLSLSSARAVARIACRG
jgi:hypothetical protein